MNHPLRLLLVVLVLVGGFFVWKQMNPSIENIPVTEEPIIVEDETTPETLPLFSSEKGVSLFLSEPISGSVITSPLTLSGTAPGTWYFEASFPVSLVNWDGLIIAQGIMTAHGDWMTQEQVPFQGVIEFTDILPLTPEKEDPKTLESFMKKGTLILKKDNPSGLPENDDALEIPVLFAE